MFLAKKGKTILDMINTEHTEEKQDPNLKIAMDNLNFEINVFCIQYNKIITDTETNTGIQTDTLERPEEQTEEEENDKDTKP